MSSHGSSGGQGTFVPDVGDVRGHRDVPKQKTSSGKVTEDQLIRRIDTPGFEKSRILKNRKQNLYVEDFSDDHSPPSTSGI